MTEDFTVHWGVETPQRRSTPWGTHRVLDPVGSLPQAARRLDARAELWPDEVRIDVEMLNLDAASYHQLRQRHGRDVDDTTRAQRMRQAVLDIVADRGKMQNPVTGSGGMLIGTVAEVGAQSPLGLSVGDRVATLVSLSLTPLSINDGLVAWDGTSERVPTRAHAILFGRSIAAVLPPDLPAELALMVMDVCGAPALVSRVVGEYAAGCQALAPGAGPGAGKAPIVCVLGAAGKSGALSLVAARRAGAGRLIGVVPSTGEAAALQAAALADDVVLADARHPLTLATAVADAGGPADITVVCVDVPGTEQPAIMATAQGGTVVFFSMATDFAAAALGAEGMAADVRMLIGNGYTPGHADLALDLVRSEPSLRALFVSRLTPSSAPGTAGG